MGLFEDINEDYDDRKIKHIYNALGKRECKLCGKSFRKEGPNQKYCSEECGRKVWEGCKKGHTRLRFSILTRDNFECKYCGKNPIEDDVKLQVDHINPKSQGGPLTKENLITSCNFCNGGKSDVLLDKHIELKLKRRLRNAE